VVRGNRSLRKIDELEEPPVEGAVDVLGIEHALGNPRTMRDGHDDRAADKLREGSEHRVGDSRAPILADDICRRAAAKAPNQLRNIRCERRHVVEAVAWDLGRRIPPEVQRYGTIADCGKRWQLMAPRPRCVRKSVQKEDERTLPVLEIGEIDTIGADVLHRLSRSVRTVSSNSLTLIGLP